MLEFIMSQTFLFYYLLILLEFYEFLLFLNVSMNFPIIFSGLILLDSTLQILLYR